MARSNQKKGSILFIKGVDSSLPAEYIDSQSARNSENFNSHRGLIVKRSGTTALGGVIGGTDVEIMNGKKFIREGTAYNVRVGRDKVERYNVAGTTWVDITGTDPGDLTGTTSDLVSIAVPLLAGKRILTITNGKDVIRKWTATGDLSALGGTPPVPKFVQEYKTYLVCANIAGGTDVSQRVQWSDTADPETWDTGNSGSVDLVEDGDDITGLGILGDYLTVHKTRAIYLGYLVSSDNIFKFDRKGTGAGTVANNSIVSLPTGEQVFLAKDGLRVFNGISAPLIDSPINDEIRDSINPEYAFKAWGVLVRERDEVWIGVPIGSQETGETVYKFNYVKRVIYKDTRPDITAAWLGEADSSLTWDDFTATWDDITERWNGAGLSEGADRINLGSTDGYTTVVDSDSLTDNGTTVTAIYETGDFQHSQDTTSRWLRMELWAKGGSVTVQYSVDGGDTWTGLTGSPVSLSDEFPSYDAPDILYFDVFATKIRFKFINSESDESLSIKQFIVGYVPRELRQ